MAITVSTAMAHMNFIGPQVRALRTQRRWSQRILAAKLQEAGFDISRSALAKIEARLVKVTDYELFYFSSVFRVGLKQLFPAIDPHAPNLNAQLEAYLKVET